MKEEIKEIIDYISSRTVDDSLLEDYFMQLEDYITNLQERNNNLTEDFKRHIDRINELTERSDNLQEKCENYRKLKERYQIEKELYKQRNEKAIEFIEEHTMKNTTFKSLYLYQEEKEILLNILKGDKDE